MYVGFRLVLARGDRGRRAHAERTEMGHHIAGEAFHVLARQVGGQTAELEHRDQLAKTETLLVFDEPPWLAPNAGRRLFALNQERAAAQ